jgi:PAS domain S-box-containing protein
VLAFASLALRFEVTVVGVMNVGYDQPHHYEEPERRVLNLLATQAAIAIQNARLHQQVRTYAGDLEQRVADRTAELDRQRRRLQTILDSAGEGIQIMDVAGQIEYINPATTRITGYSAADVIGHTLPVLNTHLNPPAVVQDVRQAMNQARLWEGVVVSQRQDGSLYDASVTVTPLTDAHDQLTGFVAVHRDVSRFRELDRLKDLFVSRIGHELRTPVANVKLYLELMERSTTDRYPLYLQTLQRETDRLRRLIDGFLEMAQLDAGTQPARLEPVNLNDVLNDLLEDRSTSATQRQLALVAQPVPDMPSVLSDRARLTQAAGKIIDNALFYTPPGGTIALFTQVCVEPTGTFAALSVSDSGPGIAATELPHLFERFYRGEAARDFKVPGAGLGLSIAEALIRPLGGHISVESHPGHGATFTLRLPVNHGG